MHTAVGTACLASRPPARGELRLLQPGLPGSSSPCGPVRLPGASRQAAPWAGECADHRPVSGPLTPAPWPSPTQVLGSGIAGLTYALQMAEHGRVVVVSKDVMQESNTQYAQGGICGVMDAHDSVESHISDTVVAGAFLCNLPAVEAVCREGASAVHYLADLGAQFSCDEATGAFHLAREGGHTHHRVVHAADATGAEIERALVASVRSHPRITVFERHLATDLVTEPYLGGACLGADTLDRDSGAPVRFLATVTMLATGGAGHCYPCTTNPSVATGDGMAMAHRAGATMANLEFVQFHPTALYAPDAPASPTGSAFLISEAVRGAGGRLFNAAGERFMPRYDRRGELAPRDVVARCIDAECKRTGEPCVWLDISHRPAADILSHFPNIAAHCARLGIDITRHRIPVIPAAHYFCGGVVTDLHGQTSVSGLFAAGEVACTGLHGANRLASNSLLEGVVFSRRAAPMALAHARASGLDVAGAIRDAASSAPRLGFEPSPGGSSTAAALRQHLQSLMWSSAGIVRSTASLATGLQEVLQVRTAAEALISSPNAGVAEFELRSLVTVSDLVLRCALQRKESRGLHFNTDFPEPDEQQRRHSIVGGGQFPWRSAGTVSAPMLEPAPSSRASGSAIPRLSDGPGLSAGSREAVVARALPQ